MSWFSDGHRRFLASWNEGIVQELTFAQFHDRARRWSVPREEPIALLSHPSIDSFTFVGALLYRGIPCVLLNWRQPAQELKHAVTIASLVVYSNDLRKLAESIGADVPMIELAREAAAESASFCKAQEDSKVALVMFTSGSTGKPKGVPITHGGARWACLKKREMCGSLPNGTLGFLPNFHVMGVVNNFLFNATCQCPSYVYARAAVANVTPEILSRAARDLRPDAIDTVPVVLQELVHQPELLVPFKNCMVTCGGAPLSSSVYRALCDNGVDVIPHYGQTELGGGFCLVGAPRAGPDLMRPVKGLQAFLLGEDRETVVPPPSNEQIFGATRGELVIIGCESLTTGYVGYEPFRSRYRYTGDIFEVVDGWLRHVCRKDDVIVLSSGELTNPVPVEATALAYLPRARRVCVVGQSRPAPVMFVEGDASNLSEALSSCNAKLPGYARISRARVIVVDSMPLSAKGNVIRTKLEADHKDEMDALDDEDSCEDERPTVENPSRGVREVLETAVREIVGSAVDGDEPLISAGLSSSSLTQLVKVLSKQLGINIKQTFFFDHPTIESAVAYLERRGDNSRPTAPLDATSRSQSNVSIASRVVRSPPDIRTVLALAERGERLLDAATEIPMSRWNVDSHDALPKHAASAVRYASFLTRVDEFDADFFRIPRVQVDAMDPQQRLLLEVGYESLHESGYRDRNSLKGRDIGTFTGVMNSDARELRDDDDLNSYVMMGSGYSALGARISYTFALQGPSMVFDTACSSSMIAAHVAKSCLLASECESALVAAPNLLLLAGFQHIGTALMGMMSPTGRCRTFDSTADGFARGEGAAAVVLKILTSAQEEESQQQLVGSAAKHNGRSASFTALNGSSQARLLRASAVAGKPIEHLEAHGTGTALGDPIEVSAAHEVFGSITISGVKANAGHAEAAAGVTGLIAASCALSRRTPQPCAQLKRLNPQLTRYCASSVAVRPHVETVPTLNKSSCAGISSFGWSGIIAHGVLQSESNVSLQASASSTDTMTSRSQALYRSSRPVPRLAPMPNALVFRQGYSPSQFELQMSPRLYALFKDHVVAGRVLLPGVASIEISLSAAQSRRGLADVVFLRPCYLDRNTILTVTIDGESFDISSRGEMIAAGRFIGSETVEPWKVAPKKPYIVVDGDQMQRRSHVFVPSSVAKVTREAPISSSLCRARKRLSSSTDEVVDARSANLAISSLRTRALTAVSRKKTGLAYYSNVPAPGANRSDDALVSPTSAGEYAHVAETAKLFVDVDGDNRPPPPKKETSPRSVLSLGYPQHGEDDDARPQTTTLVRREAPPSTASNEVLVVDGDSALPLSIAACLAPTAKRVIVVVSERPTSSFGELAQLKNVFVVGKGRLPAALLGAGTTISLVETSPNSFPVEIDGFLVTSRLVLHSKNKPPSLTSATRLRGQPFLSAFVSTSLKAAVGLVAGSWSTRSLEAVVHAISKPPLTVVSGSTTLPSTTSNHRKTTTRKRSSRAPTTAVDTDVVAAVVRIASSVAGKEVRHDSPLMENGIDSLGATELARLVSKHFESDLPPTLLFDFPTPAEIAKYVTANATPRESYEEIEHVSPVVTSEHISRNRDVCISAVGCRLPAMKNLDEMYELTRQGLDAGSTVPLSRWDAFGESATSKRASYGVFLEDDRVFGLDHEFFRMSPIEAKALDPQQKMILEVGYSMLQHVGMDREKLAGSLTGVYLGMMNSDAQEALLVHGNDCTDLMKRMRPFDVTGNGYATAAARLPYVFALHGPCLTIDTACSSTLVASHAASSALRSDEVADAVVLGPNVMLRQGLATVGGAVAAMFSLRGRCHTLDNRADGYLRAEACGGIILTLDSSATLGIPEIAVRHNGRAASFTALNGSSQQQLMRDVGGGRRREFLEMHGTGTALGDPVEVGAASQAFSKEVALAAVKANIGHTESSAGVSGILKSLALLFHDDFGRNAQLRIINPSVKAVLASSLQCTVETTPAKNVKCGGVSSFGFSGIISHAVVEKRSDDETVFVELDDSTKTSPSLYRRKALWKSQATIPNLQRREVRRRSNRENDGTFTLRRSDVLDFIKAADGGIYLPATAYVYMIWMALSGANATLELSDFAVIENVVLEDGVDSLDFKVILKGKVDVVVEYAGRTVATSTLALSTAKPKEAAALDTPQKPCQEFVASEDFYAFLGRHGYSYGPSFRLVKSWCIDRHEAIISSTSSIFAYLESLVQTMIDLPLSSLRIATRMSRFKISPSVFRDMDSEEHRVVFRPESKTLSGPSVEIIGLATESIEYKDDLEHDVQLLHPLKRITDAVPPDEYARDMARHYSANAIERFVENNPAIVSEKPWLLKVARAASVHREDNMPPVDRELYDSSLYYRLHVDLYDDIPALVERPFWVISNHPEHDEFYEANYDMYQLGVLLSVVVKDHFGEKIRIRELGSGSCGLTRRILELIDPDVQEYVATDVSAIRLGVLEGHPKIVRRRYDVNEPIEDDERGKYHLVVADNVIHVGSDMLTCLRNVCDSLVDGGFVIFEECVTDAPLYLWGLDSFIWETATDNRSYGIWLHRDEWTEIIDMMPELDLVASFEVKHSCRFLFRYTRQRPQPPRTIVKSWKEINLLSSDQQIYCDDGAEGLVRTLVRETGTRDLSALVTDDNFALHKLEHPHHRFTTMHDGVPHVLVSIPFKHLPPSSGTTSIAPFASSGTQLVVAGRLDDARSLELVAWLFLRGAEKVIIVVDDKAQTNQSFLLGEYENRMELVTTIDLSDTTQAKQLFRKMGDSLLGVWHTSAVRSDDSLFDNMTAEQWEIAERHNVRTVQILDECTRNTNCKTFVVFSSIGTFFGSPGQANTNRANSACETIVRRRRLAGFSGLAVQWGPIDDGRGGNVGGDLMPMKINHCLDSLDTLLPVVADSSGRELAGIVTCFARRPTASFKKSRKVSTTSWDDEAVSGAVQSMIKELLGMDLAPTDRLVGAGVDSLMATQLTQELSKEFEFELPATFLFDYPTPLEMTTYIRNSVVVGGDYDEEEHHLVSPIGLSSMESLPFERRKAYAMTSLSFSLPGGTSRIADLAEQLSGCLETNGCFPSSRWHKTAFDDRPSRPPATTYGAFLVDSFNAADLDLWRTTAAEALSLHPVQLGVLEHCTIAMRHKIVDTEDVGVFVGGVGALSSTFNREENNRSDVFALGSTALAIVSGRVSFVLGLTGPCMTIDTACSSSLVATHTAQKLMQAGECAAALATTANAVEIEASFVLNSAGTLSPNGRCHTFDARADGYARGEAALAFLLQPHGDERPSGFVVTGPSRVRQDGVSASLTAPNGSSQRRLLREVAAATGMRDGALRLEAHGTGTALGDPIEVGGAVDVLSGSFRHKVKCSSLKANIGHAEAAAGGAGFVALTSSLSHDMIPTNVQLRRLNQHLHTLVHGKTKTYFAAPVDASPAATNDGRVSSFGFSGTIAHASFVVSFQPPIDSAIQTGISLLRNTFRLHRPVFRGFPAAQALLAGATISNRKRRQPSKVLTRKRRTFESEEDVLEAVRRAADEAIGTAVDVDEPLLTAVGFDSMAISIIAGSVAEKIGIELPSTAFFDYPTVRSLAEFIVEEDEDEGSVVASPPHGNNKVPSSAGKVALESMSMLLPGMATSLEDVGAMSARSVDAFSSVPLERWDASRETTPAALYGGFFVGAPPTPDGAMWGMPPAEVRSADPKQILALAESHAALKTSELSIGDTAVMPAAKRTAVFVGTVGMICNDDEAQSSVSAKKSRGAYAATGGSLAVTAGRISYALSLEGPCAAIDTACSTALVCMHFAMNALRNNECYRALSTAVAWLDKGTHGVIANAGMLSPHGKCFTLDSRANGYARGEGCVAFVLSHSTRSRYAVCETAIQQDGASASLTAPNGSSQRRLLKTVAAAGREVRTTLLEAHGTGTALGDPIEVGSAHAALLSFNAGVRYQSFKANVGHLEPTAGAAGIVNLLAALSTSTAAPNMQLRTLNSHLRSYLSDRSGFAANTGDSTPAAPSLLDGRVSSFGFSGTIAHTLHTITDEDSEDIMTRREATTLTSRGISLFRKSAPFSTTSHLRGIATWQRLWAGLLENEAQQKIAANAAKASSESNEINKDIDAAGIIAAVANEAFGYEVPRDEPLMALGLDSLGLGEMGAEFVERLGILLPATLLFDYPTVNDVVDYVETECGLGGKREEILLGSTPPSTTMTQGTTLTSACFDLPGSIKTSTDLGKLLSTGDSTLSTVPITRWDSSAFEHIAGPSSTYGSFTDYRVVLDNTFFKMSPLEAAGNDPQQLRLLELSYAAFHDGVPDVKEQGRSALMRKDYGVFAGAMGVTGRDDDISYVPEKPVEQISALGMALSVMSGRVSFALGLTGPCLALDTACSTTLVTLHLASSAVQMRDCSRAVSAGTIFLREVANVVGAIAGMLSNNGRCFTFDSRADGYARGEGTVACVVAGADDPMSVARLGGTAVRQDGPSANLSAPNGSSQRKLLRAVVESPSVADEIIVEAHGTGTMLGDPIEMGGVLDVVATGRRQAQITSLKGVMGHLETSAGAAGLSSLLTSLTACRFENVGSTVAVNPQLRALNSHVATLLTSDLLSHIAMPVDACAVAAPAGRINSFGFSGTIAHALLQVPEKIDAERSSNSSGVALFRTQTPHRPFLKPELVSIQAAIAHGDRALYEELLLGPDSAVANSSSKRASIVERRTNVRRALEKIFTNELAMDMSTSDLTEIDSIAMTQLVSSINDAFGIQAEIGSFVALDELDQAVQLVEKCVAATPLEEEDDEDKSKSRREENKIDVRLLPPGRIPIKVEHWGGGSGVVAFVHDETGSCQYVPKSRLAFAQSSVVTIEAPELSHQPSCVLDPEIRVALYARELRALFPPPTNGESRKLTVVGCGAAIGIAQMLAERMSGADLVAVDPSLTLPAYTRGFVAFLRKFYRDYCTVAIDDLCGDDDDEERLLSFQKMVDKAPSDQAKMRISLRRQIELATLDDLERLAEFCFHFVGMNKHAPVVDLIETCRVVRTSRGAKLENGGWWQRQDEEDIARVTLEESSVYLEIVGLEKVETARRSFAYVPFVNTVDVDQCLKCWKAPSEGEPSVIFVHGGIGVVGIAANYVRKLPPGIGLYAVQAPEHHPEGTYDWAPTPKQRAERYLSVLKKHVPNGGVFIGYSFAGNICFEIALLVQQDDQNSTYPFEFFLLEPVPPTVPTRSSGESLLEHHARFVDKIMAEELFPAVFDIDAPVRLDAQKRVRAGTLNTVSSLLQFVIDRVGLDPRFATDFERMMEFIYNLKLALPTGTYRGDVDYVMILPDGWKHYDLYWSYTGSLEDPWRPFIDGQLRVHRTIKGNHFQAFDTEENMDAVKKIIDPKIERLKRG